MKGLTSKQINRLSADQRLAYYHQKRVQTQEKNYKKTIEADQGKVQRIALLTPAQKPKCQKTQKKK